MKHFQRRGIGIFAVAILAVYSPSLLAQIKRDNTLAPASRGLALSGPNFAITPDLGQINGTNLFHSFALFNVQTGETATFSGPASITNIITRVTGGSPSTINGTLSSTIAGANLFLINPSGMMFGPNAQINVSGSFHATTADYLRFADGAMFSATTPSGSTFTAAAPQAFGFLSTNTSALGVSGSTLAGAAGKQVSLIGGPGGVSLDGAQVTAPSGTVHIASIGGAGEIGVSPTDRGSLTATSFGPVSLANGTIVQIDQSGSSAPGVIEIRGGQITFTNGSQVISSTSGSGNGADINVFASSVTLDGSANGAVSTGIASIVTPTGTGRGGAVNVQSSGDMSVVGGGIIASETAGSGPSGPISVTAGTLAMDASTTPLFGGIFSVVDGFFGVFSFNDPTLQAGFGAAPAGDVTVSAGRTTLTGSASIGSYTFGGADAGTVAVNGGNMLIDGSTTAQFGLLTGINSVTAGGANAGSLVVQANQLTLTANGQITSQTLPGSTGNTGSVNVTANSILVDGNGLSKDFLTGISTQSVTTGAAGPVTVQAGQISLRRGGQIDSITSIGTVGVPAGRVTVNAGSLSIDGNSTSDHTGLTGIFSIVGPGAVVPAGSVNVTANTINVARQGEIESNTNGPTDAGQVSVTAGSLTIQGDNTGSLTGIGTNAEPGSAGNAGSVAVSANSIALSAAGQISSNTFSSGKGGNVTVTAGAITADGTGATFLTQIAANSNPGATNDAGSVVVNAGSLTLTNGAAIDSFAKGTSGNGGNITVAVSGDALFQGTSALGAAGISAIATDAGSAGTIAVSANNLFIGNGGAISTQAASGGGGNIGLHVGNLLHLQGGLITTSVTGGGGNGGNIAIDPRFTVLSPGTIIANAVGGNGGNILIGDGLFFVSPESRIQASSQFANNGTILIESPSTDVTQSIAELSGKIAAPPEIRRAGCAGTSEAAKSSSLTLGSRGGLPANAEGPLSGTYFVGNALNALNVPNEAETRVAAPNIRFASVRCR